jgi:hypothetical protein
MIIHRKPKLKTDFFRFKKQKPKPEFFRFPMYAYDNGKTSNRFFDKIFGFIILGIRRKHMFVNNDKFETAVLKIS